VTVDLDVRDDVAYVIGARVLEDGTFHPSDREQWRKAMTDLAGHDLRVTLMRFKLRSPRANRLLWALYRDILAGLREKCMEAGIVCPFATEDDLHTYFKGHLIGARTVEFMGKLITMPPRSSKLSSVEFSEYVNGCVRVAAESWGVYVALPGDPIEAWNA
jgi:hypothetical protein